MKKLSTTITVLLFGTALAMAGCKKDDSSSSGSASGTASGSAMKKPVAGSASGTATGSASASASGSASASASGSAAPAAGGSTGIQECDDYMAALDALSKCSKLPDAAKTGMMQGADAIKQSVQAWKDSGAGDAGKSAFVTSCKSGTDAVKQAMTAAGC